MSSIAPGTATLDPNSPMYEDLSGPQRGSDVPEDPNIPLPRTLSTPNRDKAYQWLATAYPGATSWKKGSDGVYYVGYPKAADSTDLTADTGPRTGLVDSDSGGYDWKQVPMTKNNAGVYDLLATADKEWSDAIKNASGSGSAGAWAASEQGKADEVERQLDDFLKRAKGTYDLRDSEQRYAMNADDQNVQNMKAAREGLMAYPGAYTVPTMDTAYSRILAPTVPETVKPNYNLNQSVGLPGPQGFNDAQYNSTTGAPLPAQYNSTTGAPLPSGVAIPKELWGSSSPISKTPDGQPLYVDANGNITDTPPASTGYAFGTDYHAMLMRKYLTGGL